MRVLPGNLLEQVAEIFTRDRLAAPGERIAIGVSGGADSVTLLHILHRLAPRLGVELAVIHCNHQLRAEESEEDERFVRQLAQSLGLEAICRRCPLAAGNLEQEARAARAAWFEEVLASGKANKIALAHTASDQAETVFYRFLKGSGTAGLAGMRPLSRGTLLRPMLGFSRAAVRQWAVAEGLVWREDSSNRDLRFSRNWLREQLMPQVETRLNPGLETVLTGMADMFQAEEDYWSDLIEPLFRSGLQRSHYGLLCDVEWFRACHTAIQRRLVRRIFQEVQGHLRSIDFSHVEAVRRLTHSLQGHDRVIVPGIDILRSFKTLRFRRSDEREEKRHYRQEVKLGTVCRLPAGAGRIWLERVLPGVPICANFKEEPAAGEALETEIDALEEDVLAEACSAASLEVRNWEPGDLIRRPGHQGSERLKSLFQEFRISLWERKHWPVLVVGEEIVWTRTFGAARRFAATEQSPRVLRVCYQKTV